MSLDDQLFNHMRNHLPDDLELPPPVFKELGVTLHAFDPDAKTMTVHVPNDTRWQNPTGMMQGGLIAAAIDNCIGPLSYAVAPPNATTQLSLSYVRPVTPDMPHIVVHGRIIAQTRRQLFMQATVTSPDGAVLVLATATSVVMG
jgi:uncharacterized protein (TIGR00369 family)